MQNDMARPSFTILVNVIVQLNKENSNIVIFKINVVP